MTHAAHRVAVIGHGPAAIETADLLICMGDYFVDLFSQSPAPTCLIRFGSTERTTNDRNTVPRLRLFGNLRIGTGDDTVSLGDLTHYYDTVIIANETTDTAGELVVLGNSAKAAATYDFLRTHTALPASRTTVVAAPSNADKPGAIIAFLESRKLPFTTWTGWHRPADRSRVTAAEWSCLLTMAHAVPATP
ncbi:hypothetical protein [Corynebacterium meitnerae]|uniref:Uncharacterized protein n=1 Tax=Corynebacterium meitnerae TaxID=2913498 RepID=A0A9X3LXX0_9CORY|nr:hypothetical protein [Corynebacterium meitnerae]MCZ9294818.1 hypothetical protein [Corynebacterium meitnerae]